MPTLFVWHAHCFTYYLEWTRTILLSSSPEIAVVPSTHFLTCLYPDFYFLYSKIYSDCLMIRFV